MSFPPALPLGLVIFDCDGVLVDSEGPSNRAVAEEVTKLGWAMDEAESMRQFVGFRLEAMPAVIESRIGRAVPEGWVETVRARLIAVLAAELELMPGVLDTLEAIAALGVPFRVASNSSMREMEAKFERTGLMHLFARAHSADTVGRGKPAPDVFLHAAAAEGIAPGACLVIEDSVPGTEAAIAAGMACLCLVPHGDGAAQKAAGGTLIRSLSELPALVQRAMRQAA
jgi:HAD superfamily hydrolase (TIGR01509 family)